MARKKKKWDRRRKRVRDWGGIHRWNKVVNVYWQGVNGTKMFVAEIEQLQKGKRRLIGGEALDDATKKIVKISNTRANFDWVIRYLRNRFRDGSPVNGRTLTYCGCYVLPFLEISKSCIKKKRKHFRAERKVVQSMRPFYLWMNRRSRCQCLAGSCKNDGCISILKHIADGKVPSFHPSSKREMLEVAENRLVRSGFIPGPAEVKF